MEPQNNGIYHEKQRRQLCALHALNNLFQDGSAFTKEDLDEICYELDASFFNAHKSSLGLGNYDIAVLEKALASKNYTYKWFNKNKNFKDLQLENIFGFILNIPNPSSIWKTVITLGAASNRHWLAIRCIHGVFMNLDSKLPKPVKIGDHVMLEKFILEQLKNNSQALIVVTDKVDEENSWKNENY